MTPPFCTAAFSAAWVQLAGVPEPTTVVGWLVSAGVPPAGTPVEHEPLGLPAVLPPLPVLLLDELVLAVPDVVVFVPLAVVDAVELAAAPPPPLPPVPPVLFAPPPPQAASARIQTGSAR
jgi:hypothetical protein